MRFVILEHQTGGGTHWDLMLEEKPEAALTTFSLPPQKIDESGSILSFRAEAKILPPHRKEYLDYEGEISNNRGSVKRIAAGIFEKIPENCYILQNGIFSGKLTAENHGEMTILSYERIL